MSKTNEGIIIRIAGPVVDVRFALNPPSIHEALEIELKGMKFVTKPLIYLRIWDFLYIRK